MMIPYQKWLDSKIVDSKTKEELKAITDETEIKDRFNSLLEFGTGGLRGVIGAGTRRMNIYTVRHATQALANVILASGCENPTVVIAHDSRNFSSEFSKEAAYVLAANGIKSYLFDELRPTPELSFSVPELKCIAGINITASHNPKEYNGYKVYWSDGAQLSPEQADAVYAEMTKIDMFDDVKTICPSEAEKSITVLGKDYDQRYIDNVLKQRINPEVIARKSDISIIYTPFHGAGYRLVPETLRQAGFKNITTVPEQMLLDGNFPTVKSPNPENPEGFVRAIEIAREKNADLIIGTDPDADRMGIVVRNSDGEYVTLTGNQTGVILLNYIIRSRVETGTLAKNSCAIKTIVTTELAAKVCKKYGVEMINVLTGFKFIGERMTEYKNSGKYSFIFGFEESYGYLAGDYARDKDSVFASLLISEAAAYYAEKNMTLWDAIIEIFEEFGYFTEKTINIEMKGLDGLAKMKNIMQTLRENPIESISGKKIVGFKDYINGLEGLPPSNVLYYVLEDDSVLVVRPSGTEPKIKLYVLVSGETKAASDEKAKTVGDAFKEHVENI